MLIALLPTAGHHQSPYAAVKVRKGTRGGYAYPLHAPRLAHEIDLRRNREALLLPGS